MDQKEFIRLQESRSHLVILGAGASIATIPTGDKNGKKISAMDNFIKNMGLENILEKCLIETNSQNLEDIYSELYNKPKYKKELKALEKCIREDFEKFEIPDHMTIYDYLIISMRKKDLIASFNWDPLLIQAYSRMRQITTDIPDLVFLHGNVLAGFCEACNSYGHFKNRCQKCNDKYIKQPLLYPVKEKDYNSSPFIKEQWKKVKLFMEDSTVVTFFGYSAPKSDLEAINILKSIYNTDVIHSFDLIEIIDIKPKDELIRTWDSFVSLKHDHKPQYIKSFFNSILAEFPRRSIEGYTKRYFEGWWGEGKYPISEKTKSISDFKNEILPILEDEEHDNYSVV